MRTLLEFAVATAVALALAGWSVHAVLYRHSPSVQKGPWVASLAAGSAQGGLYERAWISVHRLWALDPSEVIYYLAKTDSDGQPLRQDTSYRIEGADPDVRWWSLAVYKDRRLIPNRLGRYAITATTVKRERDHGWVITLSSEPRDTNWLPSGEQWGKLVLVLRCYNPSPELAADPGVAALPTIIPEVAQ